MFVPRAVTRPTKERRREQPSAKRTLPPDKKVVVEDFRSEKAKSVPEVSVTTATESGGC